MRISHRYKFVFIAVPRTGSSTCRRILNQYSDIKSVNYSETDDAFPFYHHITARQLKEIFEKKGWNWDEYRKFCFVRNPFDRVVSNYHFRLDGKGRKKTLLSPYLNYIRSYFKPKPEFSKFVLNLNIKNKMLAPITQYIEDDDGKVLVDDILLFENLHEELTNLLSEIGIKIDKDNIAVHNHSKKRSDYRDYYSSSELIEKVSEIYHYEINNFSYKF